MPRRPTAATTTLPTSNFARRGPAPPPAGGVWSAIQSNTSSGGLVSLTECNFRSVDASYFFSTNEPELVACAAILEAQLPQRRTKHARASWLQQTTVTAEKQARKSSNAATSWGLVANTCLEGDGAKRCCLARTQHQVELVHGLVGLTSLPCHARAFVDALRSRAVQVQ